ncbi:MAG: hypothetical protein R3F60_32445 [bacterium]
MQRRRKTLVVAQGLLDAKRLSQQATGHTQVPLRRLDGGELVQ